jgi:DNA polymerase elongation subunit (family B)
LREEMVQLIKKVSETVKETDPEDIFCFTLDFFRI